MKMNYNEAVAYCEAMMILNTLQMELNDPNEAPSPEETRERILDAIYELEKLNDERVQN